MNRHLPSTATHGRDRRGANAVEFALILPLMIALLMGVMDYGWYFHQQSVLSGCVREAGRAGAVTRQDNNPAPAAVAQARLSTCAANYNLAEPPSGAAVLSADPAPNQLMVVNANVTFTSLTGLTPIPGIVRASTTMRMENQPLPPPP